MRAKTFEYLDPTDEQKHKMERLRAAAAEYEAALELELPDGPDKTLIIEAHRMNAVQVNVAMWEDVGIRPLPAGQPRA